MRRGILSGRLAFTIWLAGNGHASKAFCKNLPFRRINHFQDLRCISSSRISSLGTVTPVRSVDLNFLRYSFFAVSLQQNRSERELIES